MSLIIGVILGLGAAYEVNGADVVCGNIDAVNATVYSSMVLIPDADPVGGGAYTASRHCRWLPDLTTDRAAAGGCVAGTSSVLASRPGQAASGEWDADAGVGPVGQCGAA